MFSSPSEQLRHRAKVIALVALAAASGLAMNVDAVLAHSEVEIEAPGPAGPLKGLLIQPAERIGAPVAVIVPGSGPTDRDGNGPLIQSSTYRLLAVGLADRGIASVRIDKRGLFSSKAAIADPNAVTIGDYADDLRNWIRVVRDRADIRCVWLIGHSEGALVTLAATETPGGICGIVLLASPGRPVGDVLREQMRLFAKSREVLDQSMSAISDLEAGKPIDTAELHPSLAPVFREDIQGFMISLLALEPARLLKDYDGPALILQGTRDLQVSTADAELLAGANPKARLVILEETNHLLKSVETDDINANLATYANPDLPLAPEVTGKIAEFIFRNSLAADNR